MPKVSLLSHTPSYVSTGAYGLLHNRNGRQSEHSMLPLLVSQSEGNVFMCGVSTLNFHG